MLVVHVLNPGIMSVDENDNRQAYIQIYRSQKAHTYIMSAQIKWDRNTKCYGFIYSIQELCQLMKMTTDRHTYRYTEAKRHTLI